MVQACPHRQAQSDGRLTCAKIQGRDREVNADICAACPAATIACAHLRFSLTKVAPSSLLIRWGNGKQEMLEAEPAHVQLQRAACAEQALPIQSPTTCAACPLRQPWEVAPARRVATPRVVSAPIAPPVPDVVPTSNILVFRRKTA